MEIIFFVGQFYMTILGQMYTALRQALRSLRHELSTLGRL